MKKDEDISRVKINSCKTGLPPPPQVKKYSDRNAAIKNCLEEYLREKAKNADDQEEEEEEEGEEDQPENQRDK